MRGVHYSACSLCYKKISQFHQKCSLMRDCSLFRRLLLPEYTVFTINCVLLYWRHLPARLWLNHHLWNSTTQMTLMYTLSCHVEYCFPTTIDDCLRLRLRVSSYLWCRQPWKLCLSIWSKLKVALSEGFWVGPAMSKVVKIIFLDFSYWASSTPWGHVLSLKTFCRNPVLSWPIRYSVFQKVKFTIRL